MLRMLLGIAIGVVIGAGAIAGLRHFWPTETLLTFSNLSTFVQGYAALVALGAAFVVPGYQAWQAKHDRATDRRELLQTTAKAAEHALRAMDSSTKKLREKAVFIPLHRLLDVLETFRVLVSRGLQGAALEAALQIQCEIAYQVSALELHNDHGRHADDYLHTAGQRVKQVREQAEELRRLADHH